MSCCEFTIYNQQETLTVQLPVFFAGEEKKIFHLFYFFQTFVHQLKKFHNSIEERSFAHSDAFLL